MLNNNNNAYKRLSNLGIDYFYDIIEAFVGVYVREAKISFLPNSSLTPFFSSLKMEMQQHS